MHLSPPYNRVAFQGERGSFSEEAAVKLLGEDLQLVPRPTLEALFASLDENLADYILSPIENSLIGTVHRTYELLLDSSLLTGAEVIIPIKHSLIGCPGASLDSIKTVESHPIALAQCQRFFLEHREIKGIIAEDTAGSVRKVVEAKDPSRAAIAGNLSAKFYGGSVLIENLEDHHQNYTRFVLLSRLPSVPQGANKLSLVLSLPNKTGALQRALHPFARRGLDLLRIESWPIAGQPWHYRFILDVSASTDSAETMSALAELLGVADEVHFLGCYIGALSPSNQTGPVQRAADWRSIDVWSIQ